MLAAAGDSGGPGPGRDRDAAGVCWWRRCGHRPADLPDQPDGGGPVSGAHLVVGQEERPCGRDGVGEHLAHRRHLHRLLPDDSPVARAISVLARGYQDAVWRRTKLVQELRARLVEYYPGFLAAFAAGSGLARDCRPPSSPAVMRGRCWRSRRARPKGCGVRRGSRRRCAVAGGSAASPPSRPASSPRCGCRSCGRTRSWSRRCGPRRSSCSASSNAACGAVDQLAAALAEAFRAAPGLQDHHQLPRPGRHQRRDRARRDRR